MSSGAYMYKDPAKSSRRLLYYVVLLRNPKKVSEPLTLSETLKLVSVKRSPVGPKAAWSSIF